MLIELISSELLEHDQDYLPAVLGMATGFMVEKAQVRMCKYLIIPNFRLERYIIG